MDPDFFKRLRETTEDNNRLLHELVRAKRWSTFLVTAKWLIVIGATLGIYYYFQPAINQTIDLYKQILVGADNIFAPLKNAPK